MCVSTCPNVKYLEINFLILKGTIFNSEKKRCDNCGTGCATCREASNDTACIYCLEGYYKNLNTNSCVNICPSS